MVRFLQRGWRVVAGDEDERDTVPLVDGIGTDEQARLTAETIQGVTEDFEALRFNTAISKLMVFVRDITRDGALPRVGAEAFCQLLNPLAPHLAEELWQRLGHAESLASGPWPEADASRLVSETVSLVIQVNGKRRGEIEVPKDAPEEAIRATALAEEAVQRHLQGRDPKKVIVVPGRLVNIVG